MENDRGGESLDGGIDNPGYHAFFEALIEGRLKLGQTLKQEELGAVLGLSLSPMRDRYPRTLQTDCTLLEAEGMITVRRKVGITIFYPDMNFVGNTFQFRGLLEKEGLRKFATIMTPGWIARMRTEHERIMAFVREVNDLHTYRIPVKQLEREFHESFIAAYGNDHLSKVYARLIQKMYLIRLHNLDAVGPIHTITSMREHLSIIDGLEAGDVESAIDALDRHLKGVLHRTLTY